MRITSGGLGFKQTIHFGRFPFNKQFGNAFETLEHCPGRYFLQGMGYVGMYGAKGQGFRAVLVCNSALALRVVSEIG